MGVTAATLTVAAVPGSSVAHDVTVEGGNLAGLTGTVTLAFASDHDIADTAGNALTNTVPMDANDNTFELDNTAPTVTIGGVPETSTMPFTATITFTEPVTGFVLADIALANATAAAFTGADGDRAFTALITPTADGAVTVDVAADVARDAAGNGNAAAAQASSTYTAPSCAAPDLAGRERVWQGTLTVGRSAGGLLRELVGYGWTSRTGALSGRTAPIVLDANRYRIGDFVLLYAHTTNLDVVLGLPAAGTLVFHLVGATDRDAELTAAEKADLALHVCDARFDFSAATRRGEGGAAPPPGPGQDRHYLWENAGLTWSAGLVRTLTLSQPAVSGARAAAAVEGLPELAGPGEDGVYAAHDRIEVRVRFDAPVTVDASGGAPTLGMALGGIRREAAYVPGQDGDAATELVFALAVSGEDAGAGAAKAIANGIRLNGATIRDEGGADAVLDYGAATGTIGASAGPAALTASFLGVPPEHDGQDPFTVELRFSEEPQRLSYRTVRDSLFAVSGGTLAKALRFEPPANLRYELTLAPSGDGAVTLARAALPACGVPGAVCTGDGRSLSGALALSVPGPAALSVADAQVKEGPDATLAFAVTLDRVRHAAVTVDYATRDGTAVAGADYTNTSGTLTFVAGETRKTVDVQVLADSHDEGSETMTLALSNATGARIADGEATGTIDNSGSIAQAWIARFGRTVAEQVIEAVDGRMRAAPAPGAEVAFAGERIGGQSEPGIGADGDAAREEEARRDALRLADWLKDETDPEEARRRGSRAVTPRDLLTGSAFALTAETARKDLVSLWGRGAVTRFDGREGDLTLDGRVVTGMLGADWTRGRWTAGLIVSHSVGEGGYSDGSASGTGPGSASGTGGKVEATLTGLFPWARHALSDRLEAWGAAGYGAGELTVTPKKPGTDEDGAAIRADLDLRMAAAGLRGVLLDPGSGSGFQLTGKTDAMVVQTSSGRGKGADGGNMEPARATVTRLRLGLEASRPFTLGPGSGSGAGGGAVLTPSLEVGVRHDGGDAETGFGLDLGGGLALSDPKRGLQAELRGRGLLAHQSKGFRDLGFSGALAWEGKPGSDRGAKLRLTQTLGGSSSGGADALLARTTLEGLAANDNGAGGNDELKSRRLELKFGYGLSAFGDRFTWTPEVGVGLSDTGRDYSLSWRLVRGGFGSDGGSFELSFEARRRESANDDTPPEHEVGLRLSARW